MISKIKELEGKIKELELHIAFLENQLGNAIKKLESRKTRVKHD